MLGEAGSLRCALRSATICTPAGSPAHHLAERLAEVVLVADRDLEDLEAGGRRRFDLRLEKHEEDVEQQDRPRHPERIGHRIADRGIVVAERCDGGLERRRARSRSREQAQRMAKVQIHHLHKQKADGAGQQHSEQSHAVCL